MKQSWPVKSTHVAAVRQVLEDAKKAVLERKWTNVAGKPPSFSRERFWHAMLGCMMSTKTPWNVVSDFLELTPFPLTLAKCEHGQVKSRVLRALKGRRIWLSRRIAGWVAENLSWLNAGGWGDVESQFHALLAQRSRTPRWGNKSLEREAAHFIDDKLKGFGPKQSRHLWLWLGLTRYEMLLDSRMTLWLNENHIFPFKVSAQALGDRAYYESVLDGVQALCRAARKLPCLLDAAVFSIKDQTD